MLALVVIVLVALVATVALPLLSRRRILCPLSATLGLVAGLSWALVVLVA